VITTCGDRVVNVEGAVRAIREPIRTRVKYIEVIAVPPIS
jgi:hypothetical protein